MANIKEYIQVRMKKELLLIIGLPCMERNPLSQLVFKLVKSPGITVSICTKPGHHGGDEMIFEMHEFFEIESIKVKTPGWSIFHLPLSPRINMSVVELLIYF